MSIYGPQFMDSNVDPGLMTSYDVIDDVIT